MTDLFDEYESRQRKENGMAQALTPDHLEQWRKQFRRHVEQLASTGYMFTSEDVIEGVGLPAGDVYINRNNAVGAMMNGLARAGIIKKTRERRQSRRPNSHGAELTVWIGASFNEGE